MASTKVEDEEQGKLHRLFLEWMSAGIANGIASAILNPMDVAKTRMQSMQATTSGSVSMIRTMKILYHESGILGLWRPGLSASMAREMLYSGPRAGFYVPLRNYFQRSFGEEDLVDPLSCKVAAALTTGTLGALIANPVDVVKIRLMVQPHLYPSLFRAMMAIQKEEGWIGLYKGLFPSTLRGAFIGVGELATYDQSKYIVREKFQVAEGFTLHAISSLITGVVATTVAAPFDLLKTRAMNSNKEQQAVSSILAKAIREEGWSVLLRGWMPAYLRLGPHAMICFPLFEQVRRLFGLEYI